MAPPHVAMYLAGEWLERSTSGETFAVTDPATGQVLATLPDATAADVLRAVDRASEAQPAWGETTASSRAEILRSAARLMEERADGIARTMTLEQGKPLAESRAEIGYAKSFLSWFAGEAERSYGRVIPAGDPNKRIMVIRRPVGVVAAITPWNFPAAMVTRKLAPAIAAGCTVVLKPSELTPLTAIELASVFHDAGLPAGVLSVLCSSAPGVFGDAVLDDPRVRKITFTGSTRVGKELLRRSADTVKNMSLELGGHAPFIVFDDADVEAAVEGLLVAKFRNAGQTCLAANRIYVQRGIEEEFAERLAARMATLRVGNGLDAGVQLGPLINEAALQKVQRHLADAQELGAEVVLGGQAGSGTHFPATLVRNAGDGMLLAREETFGPIAALFPFDTEDEVVERANNSSYGLAAYYYTRSLGRSLRLADRLEFGILGVNDGYVSVAQAPFGGLKESGIGREGGIEGMDGFLETKYLSLGLG